MRGQGVVGARWDCDAVLVGHAADLLDRESHLMDVDVVDNQVSRRPGSTTAKNAEAGSEDPIR